MTLERALMIVINGSREERADAVRWLQNCHPDAPTQPKSAETPVGARVSGLLGLGKERAGNRKPVLTRPP